MQCIGLHFSDCFIVHSIEKRTRVCVYPDSGHLEIDCNVNYTGKRLIHEKNEVVCESFFTSPIDSYKTAQSRTCVKRK